VDRLRLHLFQNTH